VGSRGRLIAVCVGATILIAAIGFARVQAVRSSLRAVAVETEVALDQLEALRVEMLQLVLKGGMPDSAMLKIDETALHAAQRDATSVNTLWSFLSAGAVMIACALVAHQTQALWPAVLMGLWGWGVSGYAVALALQYKADLYASFSREIMETLSYPALATGRLPFAFMVLAGLSASFFWQAAVPCALGTYIGLKARVWRLSSDFVGPYYDVAVDGGGSSVQAISSPRQAAPTSGAEGD